MANKLELTPEEKAQDLIVKFIPFSVKDTFDGTYINAILCAKLTCKEFMGHCELLKDKEGKAYWKSVRNVLSNILTSRVFPGKK